MSLRSIRATAYGSPGGTANSLAAGNSAGIFFKFPPTPALPGVNSRCSSSALNANSQMPARSGQGFFLPGQGIFVGRAGKSSGGAGNAPALCRRPFAWPQKEGAGRSLPHFVHSLVNGRPSITRLLNLGCQHPTTSAHAICGAACLNSQGLFGNNSQPQPRRVAT